MTCVLLNSCVSPRGHLSLDLGPARPQDHRTPRDPEDLSPTCRDACPVSGHTGSRAQNVGVPSRSPLGSLHHPDDVTSGREEPGVTADPGRGPGPPLSPADHGRRQSVSPLLHGPLHRHLLPPQAGHCARPRAGTRPAPALLGTGLPRPPLCLACPTPRPSEPASFLSKVHSGSPSRPADSATGHGGGAEVRFLRPLSPGGPAGTDPVKQTPGSEERMGVQNPNPTSSSGSAGLRGLS